MIVRELFVRLGMDVDSSGFEKAQEKLGLFHLALEGLKDIAEIAKTALERLLGSTSDAAHEAENAARITGLTTQQIQGLGYAASLTGVSAEEMQHSLVHLARSAQEAAFGGGDAAAAFWQLGIQSSIAYGKARPIGELLADLTKKFAAMPDGTQKAALAARIFGREGARLIPLLDKGPAGIARLTEEAAKLGIVMDDHGIEAANRYRISIAQFQASIEGLRHSIAERLFPAATKLTQQVMAWLNANRQWISLRVTQAFEALGRVFESLLRIGKGVVDLIERIWKSGTGAKAVLVGLGAAIAAMISPASTIVGLLGLIAQDVELFISSGGKAKTITGVLFLLFEVLGKKLKELTGGFIGDFLERLGKLPEAIRKMGLGRAIVGALLGLDSPEEIVSQWNGSPSAPRADNWFQANIRQMLPMLGIGSQPDYSAFALAGGGVPPLLMRPGVGGASSVIQVGPINVAATPGTDGKQVGEDIWTVVRPHLEEWNGSKMREAADHVSKNRSR